MNPQLILSGSTIGGGPFSSKVRCSRVGVVSRYLMIKAGETKYLRSFCLTGQTTYDRPGPPTPPLAVPLYGSRVATGSPRDTMVDSDDSAAHRVFKISELTRAIASHLTLISRGSTVNLARTCRCLEEPVLSTLWETQSRLTTLLELLPKKYHRYTGSGCMRKVPDLGVGKYRTLMSV